MAKSAPATKTKNKKAAPKKKTSGKSANTKTARNANGKRRYVIKTLVKVLFLLVIGLVAYGIYLDAKIVERFTGTKWEFSAQVYGKPLALYPKRVLSMARLEQELQALGYERVSKAKLPGEYAKGSSAIEIMRRGFQFADAAENAQHVYVTFETPAADQQQRIKLIQAVPSWQHVSYFRLDPVLIDRIYPDAKEDRVYLPLSQVPEALSLIHI